MRLRDGFFCVEYTSERNMQKSDNKTTRVALFFDFINFSIYNSKKVCIFAPYEETLPIYTYRTIVHCVMQLQRV